MAIDAQSTARSGSAGEPPPAVGSSLSRRERQVVLYVVCLSLLMVGMDNTIINIALPSIRHAFGSSVAGLQWTVDGYLVVLGSFQMFSGSMADRFGRRRVFQTGLVVFTTASLACSLAPNLSTLVAFRMVQGGGGSMLAPVALSIVRNTFDDPRERAHAIGIWGAVGGISLALGPFLGGVLVQTLGWRSTFWVNVPVGVVAFLLAARSVPESKAPRPRRADPVGQVLVIVMLGAVTYAIIQGAGRWGSGQTVGLLAASAAALVGLLFWEPRRSEPLIELRFFRSVPFSAATAIALCSFAALSGFLFVNTLYLQDVRGLSALSAGLYTLPMAATVAVSSPLAGRLAARSGARIPFVLAGAAIAAGGLVLTRLAPDTPVGVLFTAYVLMGLGFGLQNPVTSITAVSGMPPAQAGVAAGTASTARQIGAALGVAIIGVVATASSHGVLGTSLAHASHPGWWILTGCGLAVLVLGWVSTTARAVRTVR